MVATPMPALAGVRALALDVDGTLAGADHQVSDRALAVLARAQDRGLQVVLVTGRARRSALAIAAAARLRAPVISCNGAVTTDPRTGVDLHQATLPHEEVLAMTALAGELGVDLTWWTARTIHISADGAGRTLLERLNQQEVLVGPPSEVVPGSVVKIMLYGTAARLDDVTAAVKDRLPRTSRSMDEFFELSPARASKWHTLRRVLAGLGVEPSQCLGIGDGENDVPWLSRIGYPVAMGNARTEVKAVARQVIGHHADDAVAAFLESVLRDGRPTGEGSAGEGAAGAPTA